MNRYRRSDLSGYERLGRAVAWPFKALLLLMALPLLVVAYPFIAILVLFKGEGTLKERVLSAIFWPLNLLAMNEFLSLGGLDNPFLSRVTARLNKLFSRSGRK